MAVFYCLQREFSDGGNATLGVCAAGPGQALPILFLQPLSVGLQRHTGSSGVPEPSTFLLFASGILIIGFIRIKDGLSFAFGKLWFPDDSSGNKRLQN